MAGGVDIGGNRFGGHRPSPHLTGSANTVRVPRPPDRATGRHQTLGNQSELAHGQPRTDVGRGPVWSCARRGSRRGAAVSVTATTAQLPSVKRPVKYSLHRHFLNLCRPRKGPCQWRCGRQPRMPDHRRRKRPFRIAGKGHIGLSGSTSIQSLARPTAGLLGSCPQGG
jgi:hypothetical protein